MKIVSSDGKEASGNGRCNLQPGGFCKWGVHIRGLHSIIFKGCTFLVPKNTEEYLVDHYGDTWMIPKQFNYFEGIKNGLYKGLINE